MSEVVTLLYRSEEKDTQNPDKYTGANARFLPRSLASRAEWTDGLTCWPQLGSPRGVRQAGNLAQASVLGAAALLGRERLS